MRLGNGRRRVNESADDSICIKQEDLDGVIMKAAEIATPDLASDNAMLIHKLEGEVHGSSMVFWDKFPENIHGDITTPDGTVATEYNVEEWRDGSLCMSMATAMECIQGMLFYMADAEIDNLPEHDTETISSIMFKHEDAFWKLVKDASAAQGVSESRRGGADRQERAMSNDGEILAEDTEVISRSPAQPSDREVDSAKTQIAEANAGNRTKANIEIRDDGFVIDTSAKKYSAVHVGTLQETAQFLKGIAWSEANRGKWKSMDAVRGSGANRGGFDVVETNLSEGASTVRKGRIYASAATETEAKAFMAGVIHAN